MIFNYESPPADHDVNHASTNKPSYFANAPEDVLGEIFIRLFASQRYYDTFFHRRMDQEWRDSERQILAATHICRHWRSVAINLPSLWNYLVIPVFSHSQMVEYLARSKHAPLTVYIVGYEIHWQATALQRQRLSLIELMQDQIHRTAILRFITTGSEEDIEILSTYLEKSKDIKDLALDHWSYAEITTRLPKILSSITFMKLQKLSLSRFSPYLPPPVCEGLTHLFLNRIFLPPKVLSDTLNLCRNLEHLHLSNLTLFKREIFEFKDMRMVDLPHLRELEIDMDKPTICALIDMLSYFKRPPRDRLYISIPSQIQNLTLLKRFTNTVQYHSMRVTVEDYAIMTDFRGHSSSTDADFIFTWRTEKVKYLSYDSLDSLQFDILTYTLHIFLPGISNFELKFLATARMGLSIPEFRGLFDLLSGIKALALRTSGNSATSEMLQYFLLKALVPSNDGGTISCPDLQTLILDGFELGITPIYKTAIVDTLTTALLNRRLASKSLLTLNILNPEHLTLSTIENLKTAVDNVIVPNQEIDMIKLLHKKKKEGSMELSLDSCMKHLSLG